MLLGGTDASDKMYQLQIYCKLKQSFHQERTWRTAEAARDLCPEDSPSRPQIIVKASVCQYLCCVRVHARACVANARNRHTCARAPTRFYLFCQTNKEALSILREQAVSTGLHSLGGIWSGPAGDTAGCRARWRSTWRRWRRRTPCWSTPACARTPSPVGRLVGAGGGGASR